uniref:Glutathione S-transferase 3, mitochondrial n=1 Tax=Globisporangium ultimum (strain ATCC 200006 / CBS 805.95 / DAOM BR144) TaxID=431595 RepID=K3WGK6_GLOUD
MVQFVLLPEHGYIPLLVVLMGFVNVWAGMKVGKARKKYNIEYPQMYAEQSDKNAKAFNCVQRAHQNMVENLPIFFALLFVSAVFRPGIAAIAGFVRILGFIAYVRGYSTGDPKSRSQGFFGYFGMLASLGLAVEGSLRMLGVL